MDRAPIIERVAPIEPPPIEGVFLHELSSLDQKTYQVARHEAMHCFLDIDNLISVSAFPSSDGQALGWTLMRNVSDVVAAGGIVHGEGFSHDKATIERRAVLDGRDPAMAVSTAVSRAHMQLSNYHPDIINLVAKGLVHYGRPISAMEFRQLVDQARWELRHKDHLSTNHFMTERALEPGERVPSLVDNDPYKHIPKEGKATLKIHTKDGFRIEEYEDRELVGGEIWVLVDDDDEEDTLFPGQKIPKYVKKFSIDVSKIKTKNTDIYSRTSKKQTIFSAN